MGGVKREMTVTGDTNIRDDREESGVDDERSGKGTEKEWT